jgi:hypothetical protein
MERKKKKVVVVGYTTKCNMDRAKWFSIEGPFTAFSSPSIYKHKLKGDIKIKATFEEL